MPKRWTIRPHDPDRIAALERAAGVPAVVAQLLLCRGIEQPQAARQFLDARLADLRELICLRVDLSAAAITCSIWRIIRFNRATSRLARANSSSICLGGRSN